MPASADAMLAGRGTDLLGRPMASARVHVLSEHHDGRDRVQLEGRDDASVVEAVRTFQEE